VFEQRVSAICETLQARVETREVFGNVAQIAAQNSVCIRVGSGVDHLWQIDDRGTRVGHQHVVCGKISVNQPNGQQSFDLHKNFKVQQRGLFRCVGEIGQAGSGRALVINHQFHQQDIGENKVGLWHTHACIKRFAKRAELHVLPAFFHQLAAVPAFLFHGATVTRVTGLVATLNVAGHLLKSAVVAFLINLRGP